MEVENAFFPGHCDTKILYWIGTGTVTLSRGKGLDNNCHNYRENTRALQHYYFQCCNHRSP